MSSTRNDERILIFAPKGRDNELIAAMLDKHGYACTAVNENGAALESLRDGAGVVIVTIEGIGAHLEEWCEQLRSQSQWSDIPILLLTGAGLTPTARAKSAFASLGNVTLIDRPVVAENLLSAIDSSLRARRRQYEIRDYIDAEELTRKQLRESENRFRQMANSIPQLAWAARPDGFIYWYNARWYEYTGKSEEEMEGWGWQSVHDPAILPEVLKNWTAAIASGTPFEMVFPLRGADGELRPFLTSVLPFRDETGNLAGWFGTNTDISRQTQAEEILRRTEKLAAVGRLASTIAHEINNPLEAVTNLLYLLRNEISSDTGRKFLTDAEFELGRISHIAKQTLGFYRDADAPRTVRVADMCLDLMSLFGKRMVSQRVEARIELGDVAVRARPGELRQVFANLFSNAVDALPNGGHVTVTVADETETQVRVRFCDDGPGIAPALRERVFEPFMTTKKDVGTGLGLWVSRGLMEKNGGSLDLNTTSNGACFEITMTKAKTRG